MPIKLRWKKLWQGIAWLGIGLLLFLSLIPSLPTLPSLINWDKLHHILAYAVLMLWFSQVFQQHWRWPVFLLLLGIGLEFIQEASGIRTGHIYDVLANTVGIALGLWLTHFTPAGHLLQFLDNLLSGLIRPETQVYSRRLRSCRHNTSEPPSVRAMTRHNTNNKSDKRFK